MRIVSVTAYHVRIPFRSVFAHALQSRRVTEAVILTVESDAGHVGLGEVLPRPYLTGETLKTVLHTEIPTLVQRWLGRDFEDRNGVVKALREDLQLARGALATFAGWESAVLDVAGKAFQFAVGDVLGPVVGPDLEAGVVIDFSVHTPTLQKYCMLLRLDGQRHIKVKVGLSDDLRRLAIVQDAFGPDHPLRLDANAAWTADCAIRMLRQMRRFNIQSVEQPVPARDLAGMRRVRQKTGVAVVADESLCSLDDARELTIARAADVFNIRIGKCGGFLACLQLIELANEAGMRCHLGTLVGETGILSRAAEVFGRRVRGFEFLEGKDQNKRLLVHDVIEEPPSGDTTPRVGLGITLARKYLEQWVTSSPPIVFNARQSNLLLPKKTAAQRRTDHRFLALSDDVQVPERAVAKRGNGLKMLVPDLMVQSAERFPEKTALIFPDDAISFGALHRQSGQVAARLRKLGIGPGKRVAILHENGLAGVVFFWGVLKSGAQVVDIPCLAGIRTISGILAESQSVALVASERQLQRLSMAPCLPPIVLTGRKSAAQILGRDCQSLADITNTESADVAPPRLNENDVALIVYTSGTTGHPKGVMLSHRNLLSNILAVNSLMGLTSDDSILVVVPLHFIHGRMQLLTHMLIGGTMAFSADFRFPQQVVEDLSRYRVTGFSGVPYHFSMLLERTSLAATRLPHLRYVVVTGGSLAPHALRKLSRAIPGVDIHIGYGQTETSPRITNLSPSEVLSRPGSCGLPVPGVHVEVVDENGSTLQPGVIGENRCTRPAAHRRLGKAR
jgi:L-alanine-DL-glutamate epimerase-like enolase superfamily enzyme/non-ribosomal peptide synthetase component E (peptide arylation enzyme)